MSARYDLAVIGAGPGGPGGGGIGGRTRILGVVLLDEQPSPGGQIYRAIEASPLSDRGVLGGQYDDGRVLVEQAARKHGSITWRAQTVWQVSPDLEIGYTRGGTAALVKAPQVSPGDRCHGAAFPDPGLDAPRGDDRRRRPGLAEIGRPRRTWGGLRRVRAAALPS